MAKKFKFNFDFGLKQGERGADGLNGLDGIDGRDGVDGINGTDGLDGISPRFRYAVTANKDTEPVFIADNINPGSIWGAVVPMYTQPQAVWMIQAEVNSDNTLASNWTGPVRVTGIDGLDGTPAIPPNYKIFMFRQSEELPAKPTYTNIDDTDTQGWVPWTDMSSGVWWEVSGDVNGVTGDITNWSEPIRKTPVIVDAENGEDGDSIETRRAYGQSPMTAPSVNRSLRVPPGWDIDLGTPPAGNYYVWEISARIKADNTLGGTGQWSIPYRLTGDQGEDGFNGATPEFRWAVNNSFTTPPAITLSSRNPGAAWSTTMPGIPSAGQCIWETHALINEDNTLYSNWVPPRPKNGQQGAPGEQGIQGEQGPTGERGPTGADGTSGIPGVSYENRFSLGTDESFLATFNGTVAGTRDPSSSGWSLTVPEPTSLNPYIWMIQARIQRATNEDPTGALEGVWSVPFRLSGVNGLPGNDGNSQVVYPQGVFDNNTAYIATNRVAPYVFDPLDGNFYVANFIGSYTGNEQDNRSPAQDYANNGGIYWQLITAHEAIFAKLGIIANGLIGSAVFNTDYMFSQQGVNSSGDPSTNYELFDPETPVGGDFTPNMMINFATGEARFAKGNIIMSPDGSASLANGNMTIDANGSIDIGQGNFTISQSGSVNMLGSLRNSQNPNRYMEVGTESGDYPQITMTQNNGVLRIGTEASDRSKPIIRISNTSTPSQWCWHANTESRFNTGTQGQAGYAQSNYRATGITLSPGNINNSIELQVQNGQVSLVKFGNLPTSATGLVSGQVWRDAANGNVLKIVP